MTEKRVKLKPGEELLYDFVSYDGKSFVFEVCGVIQRKLDPPKVRYLSKEQKYYFEEANAPVNNGRFLTK